jgi:FMN phosphatase YigB (HAD superfamily)
MRRPAAMTFKILSDFDGVWTDPEHEARAVLVRFGEELAQRTERGLGAVLEDLEFFRAHSESEPHRHGWTPGGRLTAYADEDPFLAVSGIASALTSSGGERAAPYVSALARESGVDFMTLADRAFRAVGAVPGVGALLPEALDVLEALETRGCDLVIVSNSDTSKLVQFFAARGVHASPDHGARVRVRGLARKWALGPSDEHIVVRGRRVLVDRPDYRRILDEERPDLVVGDVFSLDLALPFHMRATGASGAPATLVHRPPQRPSAWVAGHLEHGHVDAVAPHLRDLDDIVDEARRVRPLASR